MVNDESGKSQRLQIQPLSTKRHDRLDSSSIYEVSPVVQCTEKGILLDHHLLKQS